MGFGVRKMRDVIDDDERKIKPTSMLMLASATILGVMILYNALVTSSTQSLQLNGTTRMQVSVPETPSTTVVFKYDADVEKLQRELLATGHYKGMVDGVMGQRTQKAIQDYQHDNALQETGVASSELINHIRYTRKIKAAAEFTGSLDTATETVALPMATLVTKKNVAVNPTKLQQILRAQMTLANLGYDVGEPSGAFDDQTRAAILKFQMDNGMPMEGRVDEGLLAALAQSSN